MTLQGIINVVRLYDAEDAIETFYAGLEHVLKLTKKYHMAIVMGDLNAKIGQGAVKSFVGKHGWE